MSNVMEAELFEPETVVIPFDSYTVERDDDLRHDATIGELELMADRVLLIATTLASGQSKGDRRALRAGHREGGMSPEDLFACADERVAQLMKIWERIMTLLWDLEVRSNP